MSYRVPDQHLAFANHLADLAGEILRDKFANPPAVETKADGSPVTDADHAVEQAIRSAINLAHPAHGIIGEEFPERAGAEYVWIIDPLDGTKEYVQGLPLFGVLIALCHRGRFVLGLAEQPQLAHRWLGADGHGTTRNGRRVHTRACSALSDAVISTMGYDTFCAGRHAELDFSCAARRAACSWPTVSTSLAWSGRGEAGPDRVRSFCAARLRRAGGDRPQRRRHGDRLARPPLDMNSSGTILAAGTATLHGEARAALEAALHAA